MPDAIELKLKVSADARSGIEAFSGVARMETATQPVDRVMPCLRAESGELARPFPGFRFRCIRATVGYQSRR